MGSEPPQLRICASCAPDCSRARRQPTPGSTPAPLFPRRRAARRFHMGATTTLPMKRKSNGKTAGRRAWPGATRPAISKPRAHHASLQSDDVAAQHRPSRTLLACPWPTQVMIFVPSCQALLAGAAGEDAHELDTGDEKVNREGARASRPPYRRSRSTPDGAARCSATPTRRRSRARAFRSTSTSTPRLQPKYSRDTSV